MSESFIPSILVWLALAVLLGYLGKWANETFAAADHPAWRATLPAHPVVLALLLGSLPGMPPPPVEGTGLAGTIIFYGAAGVLAVPVYNRLRRRIEGEEK